MANETKKRKIKWIVSDVDGTLTDTPKDHSLHPRVCEAVQKAMANGVIFSIASGRPYAAVRPYVELLGANGPTICSNGSEIVAENGVIQSVRLPKSFVRQCVDYALAHPKRAEQKSCQDTTQSAV